MQLRILTAIFVATILAFGWGAFAWTSGLYAGWAFKPLPSGESLPEQLSGILAEDGAYVHPAWDAAGAAPATAIEVEQLTTQRERGPQIMVLIRHQPVSAQADLTLAKGFVLEFFASAIVAAIMAIAAKFGARLQDRVGIAVALALFAVCSTPVLQWNFWHLPDNYALAIGIDTFVPWLLAGLACAFIIRPLRRGEEAA